jgi:hypothetical protein
VTTKRQFSQVPRSGRLTISAAKNGVALEQEFLNRVDADSSDNVGIFITPRDPEDALSDQFDHPVTTLPGSRWSGTQVAMRRVKPSFSPIALSRRAPPSLVDSY